MVSLEDSKNPRGGFTFETINSRLDDFDESITTSNPANMSQMNDTMPLTAVVEPNFRRIRTTAAIIFQIFLVILLEVGVFVLPIVCDANSLDFNAYDLLLYIHAGFWLIKLSFDRFYQYQHMNSKRHGYLEFYRETRFVRSLPLFVLSAGNSALLVLVKALSTHCPVKCTSLNLTPVNFLQAFVTVECLVLLPILLYYLRLTYRFNSECRAPDISKETDRPLFQPYQLNDIGYKDSSYLRNVLENQADMIRYLQERNKNLVRKLYNVKELPTQPSPSGQAHMSNISINA